MPSSGTLPGIDTQEPADLLQLALPISQKVILVIDLVESVRLMCADEAGTVARWHDFVRQAQAQAIPAHYGRLVKSLGDGLMVEFEQACDAVNAAQTLHATLGHTNAGLNAELQMHLRAGINSCQVYTDQLDIYGAGVNLAARLATLAGPGETVVSASVRDGLTDGLDAHIEDLGECYLKHIEAPVRAYRVGVAGAAPVVAARLDYEVPLQPTIAVIPFEARSDGSDHFAIGELIADAVIGQLGKSAELRVISRLSTTIFRGRDALASEVGHHLGASYILSGGYVVSGGRLLVSAELSDAATQRVVWVERVQSTVADLLQVESEVGHRLSEAVCAAVIEREAHRATVQPLPTLQSYSLMLGAITLMHRATSTEFNRARDMLDRLRELHRRHALPLAWLGKWYVLQVAQGWSNDPQRDANEALNYCERALELDSHSALAIAVTGQVHGYLRQDLDMAERMYHQALSINPNEPLAWLWLGMSRAFRDGGESAMEATERALGLSPLDPLRYYYQSLAASAAACTGHYERAIELARASIRINRTHSSTYRALAIAQVLSGDAEAARKTVTQLLVLEPHFTVRGFTERFPAAQQAPEHMHRLAQALSAAGLPD